MPAFTDMVADPRRYFTRPADIIVDEDLTDGQKKRLLDAWRTQESGNDLPRIPNAAASRR